MSDDKGYRVWDNEKPFDYDKHLRKTVSELEEKKTKNEKAIENAIINHPALYQTITNTLINHSGIQTDTDYYRLLLDWWFEKETIKQHIIQTNGAIIALLMRGKPNEAVQELSERLQSQDMRFLMNQLPPSKQAVITQKIKKHSRLAVTIATTLQTFRGSSEKIKQYLFDSFEHGRDRSANLFGQVSCEQYYWFPVFFISDSSFSLLFHGWNGYCALGKNGMPYFVIKESHKNSMSIINHELTHAVCKYVFPEYDGPELEQQSDAQITLQTIKKNVKEEIIAYSAAPSSLPVGHSLAEILLHEKIYDYSWLYFKGSPQQELTKRIQAAIKVLSLNAYYIARQAQWKLSDQELLVQLSQRPLEQRQSYALSLLASLKHGPKSEEAILEYAAEKSKLNHIQALPEFSRFIDQDCSIYNAQLLYLAAMQGLIS